MAADRWRHWQFPFRKMDSMNLQKKIGISSSEHTHTHTFSIHWNIPYSYIYICLHHAWKWACMNCASRPPRTHVSMFMMKEKMRIVNACVYNYSSRIHIDRRTRIFGKSAEMFVTTPPAYIHIYYKRTHTHYTHMLACNVCEWMRWAAYVFSNKNDANTIQINRVFDAGWGGRQQLNQLRYSFRITASRI